MKARKLTALILTFLMLFLLPSSVMAQLLYSREPSDDVCPYSPAWTHDWSGWYIVKEPTCTEPGLERRICMNDCGWDQTEEIPALGHSFGSWETVKEADCISEGEMERTCENCGYTETTYTEMLPHTWTSWETISEADCNTEGEMERTCVVCGYTQTTYTDSLPHTWSSWETTVEAGDYSAGQRTRTCVNCGETESQRFYPEGTLQRGDSGDSVKELQECLNETGHDCGAADGIFGGKTEAAVKQFEEVNGLNADGVAWPGVISLLKGKTKSIPGAVPELKLTGGQVHREGNGFNEIILMDMILDNTGDVPLSVSITGESWAGASVSDAFSGWPDGTLELQPGETFPFQYQISLREEDLDVGYIYRTVKVSGRNEEHDLYTGDSFLAALPIYGEADTGRIQLVTTNVLREGAGGDAVITALLTVADLGKTDLDVWVRSSDSTGEAPSGDAFTDWPENGEGSVFLTPGDSHYFSYVMKPSAQDLLEGRINRTVTAEGVDPVSGQGFVSHVDLSYELSGTEPAALLHVNYHGGPGHEEDRVYQSGELLHLDYTVNNYSNVELRNASLLYEVLSADGTCLYKDMTFTGEYGDDLNSPMFGGMLLYIITEEAAENGPLTVFCWAEAERTDIPGEIIRSENVWRTEVLTKDNDAHSGGESADGSDNPGDGKDTAIPGNDETVIPGDDEETDGSGGSQSTIVPDDGETVPDDDEGTGGEETGGKKWKSKIYVSAYAEDRTYSENESIEVTITITNAGEEPVANLMGQLYIMDDPEFEGSVQLESEAPVYDDFSAALAPEYSVPVKLTHVVTKEEAARGHVYLAARAEGKSTGVAAYCADTAVLNLSASPDSSSGKDSAQDKEEPSAEESAEASDNQSVIPDLPPLKADASLEIQIDPETEYFVPRVPVNYEITVKNTGTVALNEIKPYDPDGKSGH
ncbi:MAG: peptidoglycan-binding protein, partial [Blautia sp.]|nr:peptidoglycan-binding protein [Blautia sp.]